MSRIQRVKKNWIDFAIWSRNQCSAWLFNPFIGLVELENRWEPSHEVILVGFQLLGTFLEVDVEISKSEKKFDTSKKVPSSWNPNNITSWDGCHLFSNSTSPIKGLKSHVEHRFLAQMAKFIQLFLPLWISTSTSKKVPRSWNPNNITSWDGFHLFSNSTSPIKGSKSGAEHWFLAQMAKSIQFFSLFEISTSTSKKVPRS